MNWLVRIYVMSDQIQMVSSVGVSKVNPKVWSSEQDNIRIHNKKEIQCYKLLSGRVVNSSKMKVQEIKSRYSK